MIDPKRIAEISRTFDRLKKKNNDMFSPQYKNDKVSLFIGYTEGRYAVAISGENLPSEISSTNLISVEILNQDDIEESGLKFILLDDSVFDIFITFVFDLESLVKEGTEISLVDVYNRYRYWQKMFKSLTTAITESTLKGLICELYILKEYFIPKYGVTESVKSWTGLERTHKDFAFDNGTWFEVKAINSGKKTVQISSLEQLDSDVDGYLVVSELEKTSPNNKEGINLISVFENLRLLIEEDAIMGDLYSKVFSLGVDNKVLTTEHHELNEYRYIIKQTVFYHVDSHFPRLLKEKLPVALGNVSYELQLTELSDFLVSDGLIEEGKNEL